MQASHIEAFGVPSHYKRDFGQLGVVEAPTIKRANPLQVPEIAISGNGRIPSSSAKPDQRVNVRVPIARLCGDQLAAGQIAFVSRGCGPDGAAGRGMASSALNVLSLEQMNELLSKTVHHVQIPDLDANSFFTPTKAKSLLVHNNTSSRLEHLQASTFDMNGFFNAPGANKIHPVRNYALDGVVCTSSDEGGVQSSPICLVAVKGPAPVLTQRIADDKMRAILSGPPPPKRTVLENHFLHPADVMARVYVVLVAVRQQPHNDRKWMLRYEMVSSSNVMTTHSHSRFTANIGGSAEVLLGGAERVVLKVTQLGHVVDTKFGDNRSPSIVVSVNIRPLEATVRKSMTIAVDGGAPILTSYSHPIHVWDTFGNRPVAMGGRAPGVKYVANSKVLRTPIVSDLQKPLDLVDLDLKL